jgi:ABC-type uncharacterized transport system ATPase subunit
MWSSMTLLTFQRGALLPSLGLKSMMSMQPENSENLEISNRNVTSKLQHITNLCLWISVVLLLDEPTWDLDPLNTYLVISILSNHARKYGRAVILTMEKPRSDVFPFLDRVAYLCLGDVVYTGGTRLMLDYFRSIGFPCPELENPLMYYCKYEEDS